MLSVFLRLDEALSQYFGAAAEVAPQEALPAVSEPIRRCPQCGRDMVLKTRKSGGLVSGYASPPPPPGTQYCHAGPSFGSVSCLKADQLHQFPDLVLVLKWWPQRCEASWELRAGGGRACPPGMDNAPCVDGGTGLLISDPLSPSAPHRAAGG